MKDKKLTILFPRIKQRRDHVNLAVPSDKVEVDLSDYVTEADLSSAIELQDTKITDVADESEVALNEYKKTTDKALKDVNTKVTSIDVRVKALETTTEEEVPNE